MLAEVAFEPVPEAVRLGAQVRCVLALEVHALVGEPNDIPVSDMLPPHHALRFGSGSAGSRWPSCNPYNGHFLAIQYVFNG